jgi:hypothetical protein
MSARRPAAARPRKEEGLADETKAAGGNRPEPAAGGSARRPYAPPSVVEYGSVSKLTTQKSGVPTDAMASMV